MTAVTGLPSLPFMVVPSALITAPAGEITPVSSPSTIFAAETAFLLPEAHTLPPAILSSFPATIPVAAEHVALTLTVALLSLTSPPIALIPAAAVSIFASAELILISFAV